MKPHHVLLYVILFCFGGIDSAFGQLPVVTITATDPDAGEPNNNGEWTISRTGSTATALTVNFTISGTATRGGDYTLPGSNGTNAYTIPAGQSSLACSVAVVNDPNSEVTQTATCTIAGGAAYTVGTPSNASITITDDDGAGGLPTMTITATNPNAAEPGTAGTFTVIRTGATGSALTVNYSVSGTAASGSDFTALGTSVSIAAGQASATLTVTPIDDTVAESTETVIVGLTANVAYSLGSPASATVNIADNDTAAAWTLVPDLTYATHGTRQVKLDIYRPAVTPPGPTPVFIWIPGGGWATVGRKGISDNYKNFVTMGFTVVSIEHTNSGDAKWPMQIQDCKAAVRWLRANAATYNLDPSRFSVGGFSSGGHMSAMLGTSGGTRFVTVGNTTVDLVGPNATNAQYSDAVQAVAPMAPPTHLLWMDHYFTSSIPDHDSANSPESQLFGFPVQTIPEMVSSAIPQMYIGANTPPFFITQGTRDTYVPFNASELLNEALVKAGRTSTYWTTVNGGHDETTRENAENVLLISQFLRRILLGEMSNAQPVPSFTTSVTTGAAPLTVNFNASASSDSDGTVTKYVWSYGDDTGASGAAVSYTFTKAGNYPVTLAVRDDLGASASLTRFITVLPTPPASGAPPSVSITAPADGLLIMRPASALAQVTASDSDGTVSAVEFFLDGQSVGFDRLTPFLAPWGNLSPGAHTAAARAYDDAGNASLTLAPVTFWVADPASIVTLTDSGGFPALQYLRPIPGAAQIEVSENLGSWSNGVMNTQVLGANAQWQMLKATDSAPLSGTARRFYRVKTTTP